MSSFRYQIGLGNSINTRCQPPLRAEQLFRFRHDTGRLKMLETIAQAIDVPIAPFMKTRHAVTFALDEDDVSLSL